MWLCASSLFRLAHTSMRDATKMTSAYLRISSKECDEQAPLSYSTKGSTFDCTVADELHNQSKLYLACDVPRLLQILSTFPPNNSNLKSELCLHLESIERASGQFRSHFYKYRALAARTILLTSRVHSDLLPSIQTCQPKLKLLCEGVIPIRAQSIEK